MSDLSRSQLKNSLKVLEDLVYNHNKQIEIWCSHWDQFPVLSVYLSRDEKRIIIDAGYDTKDDYTDEREEKKKKIVDIIRGNNVLPQYAALCADRILDMFEQTK